MRRHVGNALARARRDLRFALVDRYRALLASRFVAVTALVAGVVDRTLWLVGPARARLTERVRGRGDRPGARLAGATLTAGAELAITVHLPAPDGAALGLRRGADVRTLATTSDVGTRALRLTGTLPADAADGADWTVVLVDGAATVDIVAGAALPGPFTTADGRLVLRGVAARPAGVAHTLEVGVRTALLRWTGTEGDRLQLLAGQTVVLDLPSRGTGPLRSAEIDLAVVATDDALTVDVLTAVVTRRDGRRMPLVSRDEPFGTAARPADPLPVRVTPVAGRTVELSYSCGRLEIRGVAATATVWR